MLMLTALHWLCVLYVEPLSPTAPMVSGNTQGHFGKEKRSNFFKTKKYHALNGSERLLQDKEVQVIQVV